MGAFAPPGPLLVRLTPPGKVGSYLNAHGKVSRLSYRWGMPGGPLDAGMSLDAPVGATIDGLIAGATVEITRGAGIVWTGQVNNVSPGNPWQISCDGLGGLATRETAQTDGFLGDIVDASIADGLPWTHTQDMQYNWFPEDTTQPITATLDEVLSSTLMLRGERWTVDNNGLLTTVDEPDGAPTLLVRINDPSVPVGITEHFATRVRVLYDNGGTLGPASTTVVNTEAEAKFGRVSVTIHDPSYETITLAEAQAYGQTFLNTYGPRLTVTGGFTITAGQITTKTGGPIDLPDVAKISGQIARLQFATPLYDAQVGAVSTIDIPIGSVTYDDDAASLTLEPINSENTPTQKLLAGAERRR